MRRMFVLGVAMTVTFALTSTALAQTVSPLQKGAASKFPAAGVTVTRLPDEQKRSLLARAAKLSAVESARLTLFTSATMTPRQPAVADGGLYLERPADYDPLRDLIAFYGTQGNLYVRFHPGTLVAKAYLVDVAIRSELPGPADFRLEAGPSGPTVGEGFVSAESGQQRVSPGEQHLTMAVRPKDSRWYWVMFQSKLTGGLWLVRSAEVTALR